MQRSATRTRCALLSTSFVAIALAAACTTTVAAPDFADANSGSLFDFTDSNCWRIDAAGNPPALELLSGTSYQPPFRSPLAIALLRGVEVGDFDLDVDVQSTSRDYGHRDLCVIFGWQSPSRFYYVHLAPAPDPNAHNVFLVADAPRRPLGPVSAHGVTWGEGWHHVRVERRAATGIAVFWDRQSEPILKANDATWMRGRIGLGSFDDTGRFANLRVCAR